ncbi:uncharacterized [Lates japonicus]
MVWNEPIGAQETSAKPIGRWAMETKLTGSSFLRHHWSPQAARVEQHRREKLTHPATTHFYSRQRKKKHSKPRPV